MPTGNLLVAARHVEIAASIRPVPQMVLDVGCGIGRNLVNLGGSGVGVDHNADSVVKARERGLTAFVPEEFRASPYAVPGRFDALLVSHVLEHMHFEEAAALLREYLPYVRAGGRAVLITPQEAGFRSEASHIEFMDLAVLERGLHPLHERARLVSNRIDHPQDREGGRRPPVYLAPRLTNRRECHLRREPGDTRDHAEGESGAQPQLPVDGQIGLGPK